MRDYTVARHVQELELIRKELGVEQLILIGHSWGGTLAAHYLAAHPDRVERVVFEAPGPLVESSDVDYLDPDLPEPTTEQRELEQSLVSTRLIAVGVLGSLNPEAARGLAGDDEMDAAAKLGSRAGPAASCDAEADLVPPVFNYYVYNEVFSLDSSVVPLSVGR